MPPSDTKISSKAISAFVDTKGSDSLIEKESESNILASSALIVKFTQNCGWFVIKDFENACNGCFFYIRIKIQNQLSECRQDAVNVI